MKEIIVRIDDKGYISKVGIITRCYNCKNYTKIDCKCHINNHRIENAMNYCARAIPVENPCFHWFKEGDKEAYIPVSYIESYKYHTNTEEEKALAEAVKIILKDWSKTCWFERHGEEE